MFSGKRNIVFGLLLLVLSVPSWAGKGLSVDSDTLQGRLLISEILFNPPPGGADYVELYNNADFGISLEQYYLVKLDPSGTWSKRYALPAHWVAPGDWVVLTTDSLYVCNNFPVQSPSNVVKLSSMPTMNNDGGTVLLVHADSSVVDRLDYLESFHNPLVADREGVALERRSYLLPTNSAANWTSAATTSSLPSPPLGPALGTPTGPNSQRMLPSFDDLFSLEPSLFSPDGDGYNDLLNISYSFDDTDWIGSLSVVDCAGHVVRHLLRNESLGSSGLVVWDGSDDRGRRCLRGNYLLLFELYSPQGKHLSFKKNCSLIIK